MENKPKNRKTNEPAYKKLDSTEYLEKIRKRYESVTNFAEAMDVGRTSIYKALRGHPYFHKLRKRILDDLK
jgi:DNA-binding phage protein